MAGGEPEFLQCATLALEQAGAAPLDRGEACVALFDTRCWSAFAGGAVDRLDPAERARAGRFRFEADRDAYVLSHVLWRAVLQACLGAAGACRTVVRLDRRSSGQPWLPGHPDHATSLSRSGPFAAVALARAGAVGVDIERFPPRQPMGQLADVIATPAERAAARRAGRGASERALLELWSGKEAVLKAWGLGLALEPTRVDTLSRPVRHPQHGDRPCDLLSLSLPHDLVGVLAVPQGLTRVSLWLPSAPGNRPVANSYAN